MTILKNEYILVEQLLKLKSGSLDLESVTLVTSINYVSNLVSKKSAGHTTSQGLFKLSFLILEG